MTRLLSNKKNYTCFSAVRSCSSTHNYALRITSVRLCDISCSIADLASCRQNAQQCISFWQPVAPPGYLPLGHVPSIGLDPPADPVLVMFLNNPSNL